MDCGPRYLFVFSQDFAWDFGLWGVIYVWGFQMHVLRTYNGIVLIGGVTNVRI